MSSIREFSPLVLQELRFKAIRAENMVDRPDGYLLACSALLWVLPGGRWCGQRGLNPYEITLTGF